MKQTSRRCQSCSLLRDDGATLIGSLVALVILTLTIATAYPLFNSVLGAMSISLARVGENSRLQGLEAVIRAASERIRPPFWSQVTIEQIDGGYAFPFFDGVEKNKLSIYQENGTLIIDAEGFSWRSAVVWDCVVSYISGTDGVARGVGLSFLFHDTTVRLEAHFGSFPYSVEATP